MGGRQTHLLAISGIRTARVRIRIDGSPSSVDDQMTSSTTAGSRDRLTTERSRTCCSVVSSSSPVTGFSTLTLRFTRTNLETSTSLCSIRVPGSTTPVSGFTLE